jgi:radical SAM superfamily enzyme YgiQ (UPF0313 family)
MKDITLLEARMMGAPGTPKELSYGSLSVASALDTAGFSVQYKCGMRDEPLKPVPESILGSLKNSADIIGISAMSNVLPYLLLATKRLKESYPEKTIIFGGAAVESQVTSVEILKKFPSVDVAVNGRGEKTVLDVMDSIKKGKELGNVKGICYRDGGKVYFNGLRPPERDLESLPPISEKFLKGCELIRIPTSAGCPFNCGFCPGFGRLRYRSIDKVMEDLAVIKHACPKVYVGFSDNCFTVDRKRTFEICDRIKQEFGDLKWTCLSRVNTIDEELLRKISSSGCDRIFFGVESGSDNVLKGIRKGFTSEEARRAMLKSRKFVENIVASLLWGLPFESGDDFLETLRMAVQFSERDITSIISLLSPVKGTELFKLHSGSMIFVPELVSMYCAIRATPYKKINMGIANISDPRAIRMIESNPSLFCNHCVYSPDGVRKKLALARKFFLKAIGSEVVVTSPDTCHRWGDREKNGQGSVAFPKKLYDKGFG